jgi:hypothetical protein
MPLFYSRIEALNPERHADLAIKADGNYVFARKANSVPINAIEFGMASRNYPIVFSTDERGVPVAVLGLQAGENLFVDADGQWERGQYIPAYVRRYPFIALAPKDSKDYALCLDVGSPLLEAGGERKLFADKQPTDLTRKALEFCQTFQTQLDGTRIFVEAVEKQGLLATRAAKVTLQSGENRSLTGFRLIDERKFNALPDDIFLDWRRRGWIGLVYAHLASQSCWTHLVERAAKQGAAAA